jgi:hypothetical protein
MQRNVTHYLETEHDIQNAYLAGAKSAKGKWARIPQYGERYTKMYDAWLRGYDEYNETHNIDPKEVPGES